MVQQDPKQPEFDPLPFPTGATHNQAKAQQPAQETSPQQPVQEGIVTEEFVLPNEQMADDAMRNIRDLLSQNMSPIDTADALEKMTPAVAGVAASFQMASTTQTAPVPAPAPVVSDSQTRERNHAVLESMKNVRNAAGLFEHLLEIIDQLHRRADGRFTYDQSVDYLCETVNLLRDPAAQKILNFLAQAPPTD